MAESRKEGMDSKERSLLKGEVTGTNAKGMLGSQDSEVGRPWLGNSLVGTSCALTMI